MKKFIYLLITAALTASCLFDDGVGMSQSYTVQATFDYSDVNYFPDSTFINIMTPECFAYDALSFYHKLSPDNVWFDGGFILSCLQMPLSGNTEDLANNSYRCYLQPLKTQFTNNYTVFYQNPDPTLMPEHAISFRYTQDGFCTMQGCYVTNTAEVAEYVKKNFEVGDRLTLKAKGYLNGTKTGEAEIHLADYSAAKDSIVSVWTPFELMKLGSIEYVDFELVSSKPDTPLSFCMDNMVFKVDISY